MPPFPTVDTLDTQRFMGPWYVIAHIPPILVNDAYNAVERYRETEEGTIDVLYTYNEGSFNGELKSMTPTGYPDEGELDGTWGMRFVWPLKSDYRIAYVSSDYEQTIVGRKKRDYVWIMARDPIINDTDYQALVNKVVDMGYSLDDLRKVPQQPLSERTTPPVAREFDKDS